MIAPATVPTLAVPAPVVVMPTATMVVIRIIHDDCGPAGGAESAAEDSATLATDFIADDGAQCAAQATANGRFRGIVVQRINWCRQQRRSEYGSQHAGLVQFS